MSGQNKSLSREAYSILKYNKHVSGQNKDISGEAYGILQRNKGAN